MLIQKINNLNTFKARAEEVKQNSVENKTWIDNVKTDIRKSSDMNDTIQVPRTIFKGYMAFIAGTSFMSIAMLLNDKFKHLKTGLNIASSALVIIGTYFFVRPYLIKPVKQNNEDLK